MSTPQSAQPDGKSLTGFDIAMPNIARVPDFWPEGKGNFDADQAAAVRLAGLCPPLPRLARASSKFRATAVSCMAGQGVRQLLHIWSRRSAARNAHEAAHGADPACRDVYVGTDPVVAGHATAILAGGGTAAIEANVASSPGLFPHPEVACLIRPGGPAALILAVVLRFLDIQTAVKITAGMAGWPPPGSYTVMPAGGDQSGLTARPAAPVSPQRERGE